MSQNLPAPPDQPDLITLASGEQLDARQSHAAVLSVTTNLTHKQIAEQVGYSDGSAVTRFLASDRGREGVEKALRQHIIADAVIGLKTLRTLAKSAKSELVRMQAADKLVERALGRVKDDRSQGGEPADTQRPAVSININLNTGTDMKDVTIEASDMKARPADSGFACGEGTVSE